MGMSAERMYLTASVSALKRTVPTDLKKLEAELGRPEEIGAGASDLQSMHGTRAGRIEKWVAKEGFAYELATTETIEDNIEVLQSCWFGKNREVISLADLADRTRSPIGACLRNLSSMVQDFTASEEGPWCLLVLTGWSQFDHQGFRGSARTQCLGILADVVQFWDNKFGSLPFTMRRLIGSQWSDEEIEDIVDKMFTLPTHCLPMVVLEFKAQYPTREAMRSRAA